MTTTDDSAVFFYSNVLVYANTLRSPADDAAVEAVRHFLTSGVEIWISRQVLRE
jgi:predicted nucleic acid-binding protein